VRASSLNDLIYTGYPNVLHALLMTLYKRCHTQTINFHLLVEEMSITLDDVAYLLHILIEGRMVNHPNKVFQVTIVELMV